VPDVAILDSFRLQLTKREFTLITKALVGKLDPKGPTGDERSEARQLGLLILAGAEECASGKAKALSHARSLAGQGQEDTGKNGKEGEGDT
jgi:hypothetical protein